MNASPGAIRKRLNAVVTEKSYERLSMATGFTPMQIMRFHGSLEPPSAYLLAVARCYGLNLEWLISGEGPQRSNQVARWWLKECSNDELANEFASRIEAAASRASGVAARLERIDEAAGSVTPDEDRE